MQHEAEQAVRPSSICAIMNVSQKLPAGKRMPLPICGERSPTESNGCTDNLVVVDRFSKGALSGTPPARLPEKRGASPGPGGLGGLRPRGTELGPGRRHSQSSGLAWVAFPIRLVAGPRDGSNEGGSPSQRSVTRVLSLRGLPLSPCVGLFCVQAVPSNPPGSHQR